MGVQFDRILDGFEGPFQKIDGLLKPPAGKVTAGAAGYLLSHQMNDAFTGTTKLLNAGQDVYWLKTEFTAEGKTYPAGTIYIPSKPTTAAIVRTLASELGLTLQASPRSRRARRSSCGQCVSGCGTVTAARRIRGTFAGCSSRRFPRPMNWSIRRRSTRAA